MRVPLYLSAYLSASLILLLAPSSDPKHTEKTPDPSHAATAGIRLVEQVPLSFREFFTPTSRELRPSAKLLGLKGKRVRITGYMAKMEDPPKGGFYLCPRPVVCDESGGGTGELPPEAVFVVVPAAKGRDIRPLARQIEVTGLLHLGPATDAESGSSAIRLILDPPDPASYRGQPPVKTSTASKKSVQPSRQRRSK